MAKWLVKTEPSECGIDDFARQPEGVIPWDGVRNYQARNFLAQMQEGDLVFIYHSSCKRIGIAGIVRVVKSAYPDQASSTRSLPTTTRKAPQKNLAGKRSTCSLNGNCRR